MEVNIYLASTGKGFRKQDGQIGYLVELKNGEKICQKAFHYGFKNQTPDQAFLLGCTRSGGYLSRFEDVCKICLFCPSDYVCSNFYNLKKWKKLGWVRARDRPIKNLEYWKQIEEQTRGKDVQFIRKEDGKVRELEEMLRKVEK